MVTEVAENINKPIKEIYWKSLKRTDDSSIYRSECPFCNDGILLVNRDMKTLKLLEIDICLLCGQKVKYLDIEEMRNNDWAGKINEHNK